MRTLLALLALLALPWIAAAQTVPDGTALAALVPATLAGVPRADVTPYSRFVTASFTPPTGGSIAFQIHEVIGGGSEAWQRTDCPRFETIGGHEACVRVRPGHVGVSWVLDDTLQVLLGGEDETTVRRFAAALDLGPIARLAARTAHP